MQVVYRSLEKHGFSVGALHGDLDQRARMAALDAFRNDQVQLLVCSDVAARGLDIPDVSHIINYDAPHHSEDYVHRIGRTGRAGKTGVALTIVTRADQKSVAEIEKLIARKIDWQEGAEMPSEVRGGAAGPRRPRRPRRAPPQRAGRGAPTARPSSGAWRGFASPPRRTARAGADRCGKGAKRRRQPPPPCTPAQERVATEQEPAAAPPPPRAARFGDPSPRRTERPRKDDDAPVIGLGDHVPGFLLRPVPKRLRHPHEPERIEAEE